MSVFVAIRPREVSLVTDGGSLKRPVNRIGTPLINCHLQCLTFCEVETNYR